MTNDNTAVPGWAIAASLDFGLDGVAPYPARSIDPDTWKIIVHDEVIVTAQNYRDVLLPFDYSKVEDRARKIASNSDKRVTELEEANGLLVNYQADKCDQRIRDLEDQLAKLREELGKRK